MDKLKCNREFQKESYLKDKIRYEELIFDVFTNWDMDEKTYNKIIDNSKKNYEEYLEILTNK